MHDRTLATLHQLEKVTWFHDCGHKALDTVIVVSSWADAVTSCASLMWENLLLDAANNYFSHLQQRSNERSRCWNAIVEEVKPATTDLVQRKTAFVVTQHHLPNVFVDTVAWDILHLAMEAEYADMYPPGFYASQAFWYAEGRFPCGWHGRFPHGKLKIY